MHSTRAVGARLFGRDRALRNRRTHHAHPWEALRRGPLARGVRSGSCGARGAPDEPSSAPTHKHVAGSGAASGTGGSGCTGGASGTVVAACHTGDGPTKGCSEVPLPASAVQPFKDECLQAGSVPSDTCPLTGAQGKCVPPPGALGPLTPNVIYTYGLLDQDDFDEAKQNCEAIGGTFTTL